MNKNNRSSLPWPVVIFLIILFWPIGLYLLWRKLGEDVYSVKKRGKLLTIVGWLFLISGISCLFAAATEDFSGDSFPGFFTLMILFVGGGVMIRRGKKLKKKHLNQEKYVTAIRDQRIFSLDAIASTISCSTDMAIVDLKEMMASGYFPDAYIDFSRRMFVIPGMVTVPNYDQPEQDAPVPAPPAAPVNQIVICKNCGAKNTIQGGLQSECEYCGSPLN